MSDEDAVDLTLLEQFIFINENNFYISGLGGYIFSACAYKAPDLPALLSFVPRKTKHL